MFNPEKLLGGMLRSGMRGRGFGSGLTGGAALGLLGIAMEAVEHYMNQPRSSSQQTPGSMPPPPPGAAGPPVPRASAPPPPPPQGPAESLQEANRQAETVLLIRAMIAAANADGDIDARERELIMEKLKTVELSREEQKFIHNELSAPQPAHNIVKAVRTAEMASQVYAASLLAITVDTQAEQQYLSKLADQLNLDARTVENIHQQLGQSRRTP